MDNSNQLGKFLYRSSENVRYALSRVRKFIPQVDRTRDVFDKVVPFEMEFISPTHVERVLLDLIFLPLIKSSCCADCFCPVFETFYGDTDGVFFLSTAYDPGTVLVLKNKTFINDFVETSPTNGLVTVTIPLESTDRIDIHYIYRYEECTTI